MAAGDPGYPRTVAPIASVWCRQVDNEAESPGYTAIPDEFPGRREALETIRIVGNLTINIADTHDYWDPDPSQTLSFYPNLFLYPAAGGRYTCVGRMFLSTEDRPRLGMKTLVFSTEELVAAGDFGDAVLRAYAAMTGRTEPRRPAAEPDAAVFQAVGEGFLFHRGTTEPVVVVASEQWDAVMQATCELVRSLPVALVALSGFLVFPYFLPAPKVNLREFSEQVPLSLAVMRVPRAEAEGDRHAKRMQSWASQPVTLRDLTRPASARGKESLPLVLQYVRDHAEPKVTEVVQRVDRVEAARLAAALNDPEAPTGRERRKEMWRIGTAMETAALLLSRPRGRTVTATGEMAKRANEYLEARPGESPLLDSAESAAVPTPPAPALAAAASPAAGPTPGPAPTSSVPLAPPPAAPAAGKAASPGLPSWLRAPAEIALPANEPASVPVSTSDDPSALRAAGVAAAPSAPPLVGASRPGERLSGLVPSAADRGLLDARLSLAVRDLERRWTLALDARLKETSEAAAKAAESVRAELADRLASVEQRPVTTATTLGPELDAKLASKVDPKLAEIERRVADAVRATAEGWAERFRRDLKEFSEELAARNAKSEEDLRSALVAQLDLELLEAKEQGTALREGIEGRVRELLESRSSEGEERRTKEARELEQRVAILVDGRTKDLEEELRAALGGEAQRLAASTDDRVAHVERRLALERDARLAEINEAHRAALAGLQVRMQSFVEQTVRETQTAEQEKYVELLARLKAELEGSIAGALRAPEFDADLENRISRAVDGVRLETQQAFGRTVADTLRSPEFDADVERRISRALEGSRADAQEAFARTLADAESRLHADSDAAVARLGALEEQIAAREGELTVVEARLREELADLERRMAIVNDHVVPIVRQTWLKLSEHEMDVRSKASEARLVAVRKELLEEVHRAEEAFVRETSDLRDRLETAVQSHGRIWLNFLRQYPGEIGAFPSPASPSTHRTARRTRPPSLASAPGEPAGDRSPFASDPPNPMDPELSEEAGRSEPRRRVRRTA